nr:SJCHGC07063 protein [Schistosoma japonicum]
MSQLPPPLCLLWWTVFEPLRHIARSPCKPRKENCNKLVSDCISDLHYEVLQCLSEPSSLAAYRHGSGIPGCSGFPTWLFTCSRKMEYTKEFYYLESIITEVHEQCSLVDFSSKRCMSDKQIDPSELMVIRLAEFMHISWVSGRIRNLSLDEFHRLLDPLRCHNWIDLFLTRFKR